jgi:poly(hydroxyalkanoate) depolymerase family esterase
MKFWKRFKLPLQQWRRESKQQGQIFDRISAQQNYSGSQKRQYRVYVPARYNRHNPMPLVMLLHGCLQTHLDIQAVSEFDGAAERHGFIVVYPFVTRYTDIRARNCWGWWREKHIAPGSGEVADLWQIATEVCAEFSIDSRRIHIAGLSSGGCMAVAALTVHVNRFASGAVVAALAYGESPRAVIAKPFVKTRQYKTIAETAALMEKVRVNDRTVTPLFVIHSRDDSAVHIQAAENLRDSWLEYFGAGIKLLNRESTDITHCTRWIHTRYGKRFENSMVETLFLEGLGHGWYGGAPGKFSFPAAPPTAELMWNFFKRHALVSSVVNAPDDSADSATQTSVISATADSIFAKYRRAVLKIRLHRYRDA